MKIGYKVLKDVGVHRPKCSGRPLLEPVGECPQDLVLEIRPRVDRGERVEGVGLLENMLATNDQNLWMALGLVT